LLCVPPFTCGHGGSVRVTALAIQTPICADPSFSLVYPCASGAARAVPAGATTARTRAGQWAGVLSASVMPVRTSTVCVADAPGLGSRVAGLALGILPMHPIPSPSTPEASRGVAAGAFQGRKQQYKPHPLRYPGVRTTEPIGQGTEKIPFVILLVLIMKAAKLIQAVETQTRRQAMHNLPIQWSEYCPRRHRVLCCPTCEQPMLNQPCSHCEVCCQLCHNHCLALRADSLLTCYPCAMGFRQR
jgi:hypothetical protein